MKSIIYILLFAILAGLVFSAVPVSFRKQGVTITLRGIEKSAPDQLDESGRIIAQRLKDAGVPYNDMKVQPAQNSIGVTFDGKTDINTVLPLLTARGSLGFYETFDRPEVIRLFSPGDPLFSLMDIPAANTREKIARDVLGRCKPEKMAEVDQYLIAHVERTAGEEIRFSWSRNPNQDGTFDLHLLKKEVALGKIMVQDVSVSEEGGNASLLISFNQQGARIWQALSKNNIGKCIDMMMDDRVLIDPMVRDEIMNGQCMVTGKFSMQELLVLKALINSRELPVGFAVVK